MFSPPLLINRTPSIPQPWPEILHIVVSPGPPAAKKGPPSGRGGRRGSSTPQWCLLPSHVPPALSASSLWPEQKQKCFPTLRACDSLCLGWAVRLGILTMACGSHVRSPCPLSPSSPVPGHWLCSSSGLSGLGPGPRTLPCSSCSQCRSLPCPPPPWAACPAPLQQLQSILPLVICVTGCLICLICPSPQPVSSMRAGTTSALSLSPGGSRTARGRTCGIDAPLK